MQVNSREISRLAVLAAVLFMAQIVLSGLPNLELVSLLIIVYTRHLGKKALWCIYCFVLLEGLTFGFGIWWIGYLYCWAVLWWITYNLRQNQSTWMWAAVGGFFGLGFGALGSLPYFITGGFFGGMSYIMAGIPFDLVHAGGNFVLAVALFRPLDRMIGLVWKDEEKT